MAGLTDTGFEALGLADVLEQNKASAVSLFQDLVPEGEVVDTTDSSLLGRLIALVSPYQVDLWQANLSVFQSFDPEQAYGVALDNIVALAGLTRFAAKATTAQCLFEIAPLVTLSPVHQVSSSITGYKFQLTETVNYSLLGASSLTITVPTVANNTTYSVSYKSSNTSDAPTVRSYTSDSSATQDEILNGIVAAFASDGAFTATKSGTSVVLKSNDPLLRRDFAVTNLTASYVVRTATVECIQKGVIEQGVNTIQTIDTPVIGWNSVSNPVQAVVGNDLETDEELRLRFKQNKVRTATGTVTALYSALSSLDSVSEAKVVENFTSTTDSNGLPAKSFMCVVDGGNSSDIATAIWKTKPAGIQPYGNTTVSVVDTQGISHNIAFQRVADKNIYVSANITLYTGAPPTALVDIKDAIVSYIESLKIGDDVIYSRLYTPINSVAGVQVNNLYIGTAASPTGTSNIVVGFTERANCQTSFITLTTT